ncbi:MAG: hypothetical protein AAGA18_13740 [Verrucomicrobiota bacterium]
MHPKKLLLNVLLIFLPVYVLKAQSGLPMGSQKPFQLSADLRTEYDTNINTTTEAEKAAGFSEDESMKLIFMPQLLFKYPLEQTEFSFSYDLGVTYFLDRPGDDDEDLSHDLIGRIQHQFSPQFDIDIRERFSIDQEPEIVGSSLRTSGDRLSNRVSLTGNYAWTDRFSTETTYENYWLNYDDDSRQDDDRFEHEVIQDLRFQAFRDTVAIAGYQYTLYDYEEEGSPDNRDTHIFTLGAEHFLTPQWLLTARAGAQLLFYDEPDTNGDNRDTLGPFTSLSTIWNYDPRSNLSLQYQLSEISADQTSFSSRTTHQVSFNIKHYLTPKLSLGSSVTALISEYDIENSNTNDPSFDELTIRYTGDVEYEFTNWLSIIAGYRFTEVDADDQVLVNGAIFSDRSYDRHQGFFGVRGVY